MEAYLYAVMLILGLCGGCDVTQEPRVLLAFRNDWLQINCSISRIVIGQQFVTSYIYRGKKLTPLDSQSVAVSNNTYLTVTHNISAQQTDTYYCNSTCQSGTYIYVRESGFTEPLRHSDKLQCALIVLCVLLLLLCSVATYLLLPFFFNKQVEKPATQPKGAARPGATSQHAAETPLYTSLQVQSDDVYDMLEEEPHTHSSLTHRAEVHDVTRDCPVKRPKPQIKPQPERNKPQPIPEKPPARQNPRKGENNLYENLTL